MGAGHQRGFDERIKKDTKNGTQAQQPREIWFQENAICSRVRGFWTNPTRFTNPTRAPSSGTSSPARRTAGRTRSIPTTDGNPMRAT